MASKHEYRFYSFTNMYLSSIQKGIQTGHAISEMSVEAYFPDAKKAYKTWAKKDKTVIVLNGGNQAMLFELYNYAQEFGRNHNLPVIKFHEDEQSLNGALTAVGIVLPKSVYDMARELRNGTISPESFNYEDLVFYNALNACGLAN